MLSIKKETEKYTKKQVLNLVYFYKREMRRYQILHNSLWLALDAVSTVRVVIFGSSIVFSICFNFSYFAL